MTDAIRIAGHVVLAGAFFFVLQRYVNGADLETSAMWGIIAACAAGALAYMQSRRGH